MYCKYCGKQIDNDSVFCYNCGKEQSKSVDDSTPTNKIKELIKVKIKPKPNKYDESYKRDYHSVWFGFFIFIIWIPVAYLSFDSDSPGTFAMVMAFGFVLRIVITIWCADIAKTLNRNSAGWGIFGFFIPLLAMIIIGFLKKLKVDES